jgi:hypothetical protein
MSFFALTCGAIMVAREKSTSLFLGSHADPSEFQLA